MIAIKAGTSSKGFALGLDPGITIASLPKALGRGLLAPFGDYLSTKRCVKGLLVLHIVR